MSDAGAHKLLNALVDVASDEKVYDKETEQRLGRIYPELTPTGRSGEFILTITFASETGDQTTERYRVIREATAHLDRKSGSTLGATPGQPSDGDAGVYMGRPGNTQNFRQGG